MTFSLTGDNRAYFNVISSTGQVTVSKQLNRETDEVMDLGVIVSDGPNDTPGQLTIILLDANDNKPVFEPASYDVNVLENTAVGATLFTAQATDDDTSLARVIKYNIDQVIPSAGSNLFTIGSNTGEVKLNGNLNYNNLGNSYRLKINATDGGGKCYYDEIKYNSAVAFSIVTVVDVPDMDPKFTNDKYTGKVEENSPLGQSVSEVSAFDQDTGVNDPITYSIESSTVEGLFTISSESGVISVAAAIDREVIGDNVTLVVKATETNVDVTGVRASATATVLIDIIDVNDNPPEFYKCDDSCVKASDFAVEVPEQLPGIISLGMTVIDLDKIAGTNLILEGEYKNVFSVEPSTIAVSRSIVQLLIKQPQILDYEKIQQMILQVIAIDQGNARYRSTATVTINIKDTNDNSPIFPMDTYRLKVAEHSPEGTVLATITAEDPDTMDQDQLVYTLLPESIKQYFDVEPQSGTVYVKNPDLLDREIRSLYSATLQAKDTDGKPGTTVLEITLTDINDQRPVFNRDPYQFFVKEGERLTETIQATDADDPETDNSKIVYGVLPGKYSNNFTIDPDTGVLTNSGELDREALNPDLNGRVELEITATDKGTPPLDSVVTVIITIEDINDNTPQFNASVYKFRVKEAEKGAYVGSVYAQDLDQMPEFNRISFNIEASFGLFAIRSSSVNGVYQGTITVDRDIALDYEGGHESFTLLVEADDLERKSEATVEVEVVDVNDERPEFLPSKPVTVKENTTVTDVIGAFIGHDKDGSHSLVYQQESIKCRCNGSLTDCDWFILSSTGEVAVNPDVIVDYEECDQAVVEAWVVDVATEKGSNISASTGNMVINIEDINDNPPEFIPSNAVLVVVSEGASKGTSVATVAATDRDSGINAQIDFKVADVKFMDTNNQISNMRDLFEAVTTQQKDIYVGIIQTTEKLDLTLKGKYLVTVAASDAGGLSRSIVLEIFTVDESYKVELQFTKTVEEVKRNQAEIERMLKTATRADVIVVSISPDSAQASRNTATTLMVTYFVYPNGTALTSIELEKILSDSDYYLSLLELGLSNVGKVPTVDTPVDTVKYVLLGIVAGLVVVLAILLTSLMCSRRSYKRKLKAAKAMNTASMMGSDNQKSGAVVPGTNKYTMEGANPVLNLNIDSAMVLDEDDSDGDKVSLNSLDYSEDMNTYEKDTSPIMKIIREEDEDEDEDERDGGPLGYIEPLGAALAQRGEKRDSPRMVFSNPAFSTTDL
ncbi:cadherin-related family member 2 isoform X2 [Betta splendens]|nr:cadherin-related family member 2 isoform X2 [Betta splendens]